jgi:hypothetical protein
VNYTTALKLRKIIADTLPTVEEIKTLSSTQLIEKLDLIQNTKKSLRVEFSKIQQEEQRPKWIADTTQLTNINDGLVWTFKKFLANNQVLIKLGTEFDVANISELTEVNP